MRILTSAAVRHGEGWGAGGRGGGGRQLFVVYRIGTGKLGGKYYGRKKKSERKQNKKCSVAKYGGFEHQTKPSFAPLDVLQQLLLL